MLPFKFTLDRIENGSKIWKIGQAWPILCSSLAQNDIFLLALSNFWTPSFCGSITDPDSEWIYTLFYESVILVELS